MEEIIDVEYKEVLDLEGKTTEQLTVETNALYQQFISIGNIAAMIMAQAGQRLQIIKGRLPHGEWELWCENNLDFSKSKAEKMMKLAVKVQDETSVFSKTEMFTDIGISKVWALLSAPEEVAEEVLENPKVPDMTVRELKDEIRHLQEKNSNLEESIQKNTKETTAVEIELRERIKELEADLENQKETDPALLSEKEAELQKARKKLEKEKEKSQKLKDSIEAEKEKTAREAAEQAEAKAQEKFNKETELLRTSNQEAAKEIDRLQRALANSNNDALIEFKLKSNQLQQDFNSCLQSIAAVEEADPEPAGKMRRALKVVMEKLMEAI